MSHQQKSRVEFFLEQTDLSLRLARCSGEPGERCVEAIREVLVSDAAGLEEAVRVIFQVTSQPVIAALRPKSQAFHLATAAGARTLPGLTGVRQFALQHFAAPDVPAWLAATEARDGGAPGDMPWLAAFAPAEDRTDTSAMFQRLHVQTGRQLSAVHLAAGALAEGTKESALLLEIGLHRSHVFVIGRAGVVAAGSISFGVEQIAEAVQTELTLKYRGSAQKLFLNEQYDFSESAAGIMNRLVPHAAGRAVSVVPRRPGTRRPVLQRIASKAAVVRHTPRARPQPCAVHARLLHLVSRRRPDFCASRPSRGDAAALGGLPAPDGHVWRVVSVERRMGRRQ